VAEKKHGLTVADARAFYYAASDSASKVGRQLALAGIAIVWLFAGGAHLTRLNIPNDLLYPGIGFVSALAADFLQYLYTSAAWGIFSRRKEKERAQSFVAPDWINYPTLVLFWAKALVLMASYGLLASALASRIR
jgi:hypothetical protein